MDFFFFFAENDEFYKAIEQRFVIPGGVKFRVTAICEKKVHPKLPTADDGFKSLGKQFSGKNAIGYIK